MIINNHIIIDSSWSQRQIKTVPFKILLGLRENPLHILLSPGISLHHHKKKSTSNSKAKEKKKEQISQRNRTKSNLTRLNERFLERSTRRVFAPAVTRMLCPPAIANKRERIENSIYINKTLKIMGVDKDRILWYWAPVVRMRFAQPRARVSV